MSFEVGRLSAALTLDGVDQFHRELDAAGRKLNDTGQQGASFGRAAEAAVRTAAGATTGLVTAAGAYLAILTKTGIEYNSLQQNSRAALKVLLGGAEQANAQMDKLDAFAKNSPFSKSVFIQAQQQLIGFGMEAGKVIPTLDAIQQGVAAMGGSGQQISEVVNILAKVQSTGKFTAETLNELGYRGVDAATLMGDAMGKTAAQMRDDISDGAIGGAEAIDVLVEAMQTRFGGAADNVKEQWSGAVDRIKAAQRDLGAHIAEPFVSAEGGGMAVTWGNQVADVLRAIEKQAVPVMSILTQRGMPFFAGLTQGLDSAKQSIARWDASSLEVSLDKLGGHAPGIAALAGATLALGAQVGPLGELLKVLKISVNPVVAAFVGLAMASPEVRESLAGVLEAGKPLVGVAGDLAKVLSGQLNSALPLVSGGIDLFASVLGIAVDLLEKIPAPVIAGAAAFLALQKAAGGINLDVVNDSLGQFMSTIRDSDAVRAYNAGLSPTSSLLAGVGQTAGVAKAGVVGLGDAMKTAFLSNPIGIALTVVSTAISLWAMANAEAQRKVQEHQEAVASLKSTVDQTTGAVTASTREMIAKSLAEDEAFSSLSKLGITHKEAAQAISEGGDSYAKLTDKVRENTAVNNLSNAEGALSLTTGRELIASIEAKAEALQAAQEEVRRQTQAERELAAQMTDTARSNQRFNDALAVARDTTQDAETRVRALRQALDELNGGTRSARQAQTDLAETALNLSDALGVTDAEGNKLWKSFVDGSGAISANTHEGIAFERMLDSANTKMREDMTRASDAKLAHNDRAGAIRDAIAVGNEHIATMQEQMRAAGMDETQIKALTGALFDVPSVTAAALQLDGVTEAGQQVIGILSDLALLDAGATVQIAAEGGEEAAQILRDLGYEVELTPDEKNFTITAQGADVVTQQLTDIAIYSPPDKLFKIDADAADAYSNIDGVNVKQIDKKTAYVWGDNAEALQKIQTVNEKNPKRKVVEIGANDSGFWGTWNKIAGAAMSKIIGVGGGKWAGDLVTPRAFSAGGGVNFPPGIYSGRPGGIWKMGLDGSPHNFAEGQLGVPWETYISGKPEHRERNIGLAIESLNRLAFPVVPESALRGVRGFETGGTVGSPARALPTPEPAATSGAPTWNMTIINPVARDPFQDAWEQVQEHSAL